MSDTDESSQDDEPRWLGSQLSQPKKGAKNVKLKKIECDWTEGDECRAPKKGGLLESAKIERIKFLEKKRAFYALVSFDGDSDSDEWVPSIQLQPPKWYTSANIQKHAATPKPKPNLSTEFLSPCVLNGTADVPTPKVAVTSLSPKRKKKVYKKPRTFFQNLDFQPQDEEKYLKEKWTDPLGERKPLFLEPTPKKKPLKKKSRTTASKSKEDGKDSESDRQQKEPEKNSVPTINRRNSDAILEAEVEAQIHRRRKEKVARDNAKALTTFSDESDLDYEEPKSDDRDENSGSQCSGKRPLFKDLIPARPATPYILQHNPRIQIPGQIHQYLREYQIEGVKFLFKNYQQYTGCLLADDMGLGKTIQVIAFLAAIMGKSGICDDDLKPRFLRSGAERHFSCGPVLLVVPSAVLYNWQEEFETWGYFRVKVAHGSRKLEVLEEAGSGSLEVVITTYDAVWMNLSSFQDVTWTVVVCDEAHRIKNRKAKLTVALNQLDVTRKIALTGTPIQNKLEEFWTIVDWAAPGTLGSHKDFKAKFADRIKVGQSFSAKAREYSEGKKAATAMQDRIQSIFLRRTKDLIADQLPKKTDKVLFCPLTPLQCRVYRRLLSSRDFQRIIDAYDQCDCGSMEVAKNCCYQSTAHSKEPCTCEDGERDFECEACHCEDQGQEPTKGCLPWVRLMLPCMMVLQKVANHLGLIMPNPSDPEEKFRRDKKISRIGFSEGDDVYVDGQNSAFLRLSNPDVCGKLKVLRSLLPIWQANKSKVLLFSYSTRLLDLIERNIQSEAVVYLRLDGSTPAKKRQEMVAMFNTDPQYEVFLISTRAGGVGLNLTGANIVVIFDPNWNPAHDLQAQDRAFRIGQTRDVKVYRLIASGCLEELVYARQIYKQQISNIGQTGAHEARYWEGVQGDKQRQGELFGIMNLFSFADGKDLPFTAQVIKRNEEAEGNVAALYELEIPPDDDTAEKDRVAVGDDVHELGLVAEDFIGKTSFSGKSSDKKRKRKTSQAKSSTTQKKKQQDIGRKNSADHSAAEAPEAAEFPETPGESQRVNEVLKNCGVKYAHSHNLVLGESRVEKELQAKIRRLSKTGALDSQQELNDVKSELNVSLHDPESMIIETKQERLQRRTIYDGHKKIIIGATPKRVQYAHFEQLAKQLNMTQQELAQKVIEMSEQEREGILDIFYEDDDDEEEEEKEEEEAKIGQRVQKESNNTREDAQPTYNQCDTDDFCLETSPLL